MDNDNQSEANRAVIWLSRDTGTGFTCTVCFTIRTSVYRRPLELRKVYIRQRGFQGNAEIRNLWWSLTSHNARSTSSRYWHLRFILMIWACCWRKSKDHSWWVIVMHELTLPRLRTEITQFVQAWWIQERGGVFPPIYRGAKIHGRS